MTDNHVLSDHLNGVCITHISGMDSSTQAAGRLHGGWCYYMEKLNGTLYVMFILYLLITNGYVW